MDGPDESFDFFKARLKSEMEENKKLNGLQHRGAFVSDTFLKDLITKENLKEHAESKHANDPLNLNKKNLNYESRSQLLDLICSSSRKLFAILILVDQPWHITELLLAKEKVDDDALFGPKPDGRTYAALKDFRAIPQLSSIAEQCFTKQWHFPPVLSSDEIQSFPPTLFQFPFVAPAEKIAHGGFGIVMRAKIASGYLNYPEGMTPVTDIAYKKVSKDQSNQGWGNLKDEVLTLRARKHSNITPLLASFVAGLEKPSTPNPAEPQECLYMISPLAAMDMSTWLKDGHNSCADMVNHQFRDLIYSDAMLGLIRGVTYIHREIKGDVGYHRDLKPKNVLLFPRNSGWIWKICDFGCANLKPAMETGTYNFTTTHYWAPPEYFTDRDRTDAQTHGRPHDVWSLGCMFLELATMAQYGWDNGGLQEFKMKRAQCKDSTPGYNQARQDQDQSAFHSSESAVRDWISHLEEKAAARQQAKLVLRIIREMLLPRKERISAWEVNVYLFQAIDPERTESEVLDELRKVIQKSRAVDLEMKQTPMTRANKWQQSHEFCQILSEKGWLDYSPQMTTEHRKRAKAVQSYHSTLPELTENAALFGCQHIVADIFERFGHTDTLALSGMGGVGKTQIALHYASQFAKPGSETQMHTFWVSADHGQTFVDSYARISEAVGISSESHTTNKKLVTNVKQWLEDPEHGQWLLVIDNLDDSDKAEWVAKYLPKKGCGQILFTTRNRSLVKGHVNFQSGACFELAPPKEAEDRLRIWTHYIDQRIFRVTPETEELLNILRIPKLIREVADYMNEKKISARELLRNIKTEGFSAVDTFSPDLTHYFVRSFVHQWPIGEEDQWPRTVVWLFLFAFFDARGIELELARIEIDAIDRQPRREIISTLETSGLITKKDEGTKELYCIDRTVQLSVHAWVKQCEGNLGMLKRYNKVLSMLFKYYDRQRRLPSKIRDHSFNYKRRLMPHFEPFRNFIAESNPQVDNFAFDDRAIQAITMFSRVLMDQDQVKKAISILEFALEHSPFKDQGDDCQRKLDIRFSLVNQLVQAYLSHSEETMHCNEAEQLLEQELKHVKHASRHVYLEPVGSKPLLEWKLTLDSVRVLRESQKFELAKEKLDTLDRISIHLENNVPTLHPDEHEQGQLWEALFRSLRLKSEGVLETTKAREERRTRLRRLGVQTQKDISYYHLAIGRDHELRHDLKSAKQSWAAAKNALLIARAACKKWFRANDEFKQVELAIAEVDTKIGTVDGLRKARKVFEETLAETQSLFGSDCRRAWELECSINAVRLKEGQVSEIKETVRFLEQLLEKYESRFGQHCATTVRCARQLREGYVKQGRWEEAERLTENHDLPALGPQGRGSWKGSLGILSGFLVFLSATFFGVFVVKC